MLIGEVSKRSGVSTRMLRHYDRLGLVQPTGRTSGGYREYAPDDIARLFHVESLRTLGMSLADAKRALDEPGFAPAELVGELVRHTRERIAAETELLRTLERVDAAAPTRWGDVLRVVALLRGLDSESGPKRIQAVLSPDASLPVEALVAAALSEDDANVAGALRWSLARSGRGLRELAEGLDSDDADVRRRATVAIAEVPGAESTALLRRAVDDPDATVRGKAALALGSRGGTDAIPALLELVVEGQRDVEAAEALGLLAEVADAAADIVDAMHGLLRGAAEVAVRLRITQALAEIPGPAARDALVLLSRDEDRTVAGTAVAILDFRTRSGLD